LLKKNKDLKLIKEMRAKMDPIFWKSQKNNNLIDNFINEQSSFYELYEKGQNE
jgi:hypothetical protein